MYEVSVEAVFSAAHQLRLYDGSLEPLHGHDWRVTVTFAGAELDDVGLLVDFVAAEARLNDVLKRFHHTDLGEVPVMRGLNPTAEHVARVIYDCMAQDDRLEPALDRVRVTEAPGCTATYRGAGDRPGRRGGS